MGTWKADEQGEVTIVQTRRWNHLSFDFIESGTKKPFYLDIWVMMKKAKNIDWE